MDFEIVIGLEVHVQLNTNSKIFCSCSTIFDSPPNTNICPICCGYPGVLPVLNEVALKLAIRSALALNCQINKKIYFERKNYFYPDLPKNYQISQYKIPLGEEGFLELESGKKIRIKRVHLEEDAGKLLHKENYSLIDFNRTGIPLLEIVSYPEINSSEEAIEYLNYLKLTLQYIGASNCDMEKGSLRCDANISLRRKGDKNLGTKVELKNMNTFRGIKLALDYEVKRQTEILTKGGKILQETKLWNEEEQKTFSMRTKEEAHDYRYFPEPDLLDFFIEDNLINEQKEFLTEIPLERKKRFLRDYNLNEKEVNYLLEDKALADFFEETVKFYSQPRQVINWLLGPLLEQINLLEKGFKEIKISPENFAKIVKYFSDGLLNNLSAKKLLNFALVSGEDIEKIMEREGLVQESKEEILETFVKEVILENKKAVEEYKSGKEKAIMFLVGCVMKKTQGKANPQVVKKLLEKSII